MNPAALGQTIQVFDRSGKVVSTSKHLVNVFKEAKFAYRERKAEIVAGRQVIAEEKRSRRALQSLTIDEARSSTSSRDARGDKPRSRRPSGDRQHSSSSLRSPPNSIYPSSNHQFEQDLQLIPTESARRELPRRHTTRDGELGMRSPPPTPTRSMSSPGPIDMDLAYGDIPPPLEIARTGDEAELRGLVGKVKTILDEADCLQYSVTAIIASLQKNPEAMAAVALTLAEISNIAKKMAPGVLAALRSSSPAVFALLISPQFMIAAGVGVGVTIIAFGGYKIIKKIKAKNAAEDPGVDEMLAFGGDVDRIEGWRRGIAGAELESLGTSVDEELITPHAAAQSRLYLPEESVQGSRREAKDNKYSKGSQTTKSSKSSSSKGSKTAKPEKEKKVKKPSPLRLMFK
ncbi:hypothetical protein LPUS_10601 [Lasallia pustulata]|uniref:Uncharacterized protein n=1 Tax=Lasallia pustulata TaxID=136370 RepID=A0A1W5D9X2_9LECA|nr:hypothetical protein LPUS_10601 [Lasallia pustulata]